MKLFTYIAYKKKKKKTVASFIIFNNMGIYIFYYILLKLNKYTRKSFINFKSYIFKNEMRVSNALLTPFIP